MNLNKRYKDFKVKNELRIDWVNSFSKDEFIKLNNGHNMWIEGFMGGRFEDENYVIKCRTNSDYMFFVDVFEKYINCDNEDELKSICDLLYSSFMCQYERIMFEYDLNEFNSKNYKYDNVEKFKIFNSDLDNLLNENGIMN